MVSFFGGLEKSKVIVESDIYRFKLWKDVYTYAYSGVYCTAKHTDTTLIHLGTKSSDAAESCGISSGTVRYNRKSLSDALYERFGYDFFEILTQGDKVALTSLATLVDMQVNSVTARSVVPDSVLQSIDLLDSVESIVGLTVGDCVEEVLFLKEFSSSALEGRLSKLNKTKLNYLVSLLNQEGGSPKDCALAYTLITKGVADESI